MIIGEKNVIPCLGLSTFPVIVTTRMNTFLVWNSYKPSFATITGQGQNQPIPKSGRLLPNIRQSKYQNKTGPKTTKQAMDSLSCLKHVQGMKKQKATHKI